MVENKNISGSTITEWKPKMNFTISAERLSELILSKFIHWCVENKIDFSQGEDSTKWCDEFTREYLNELDK